MSSPLVIESDVRALVGSLDASLTTLTPFITTAHMLIDEEFVDSGLSAARLAQIELYLSAHFAKVRDPSVSSEGAGGISASYRGSAGMGFQFTEWGQQAMLLDPTGILSRLNNPQRHPAGMVEHIGNPDGEELCNELTEL